MFLILISIDIFASNDLLPPASSLSLKSFFIIKMHNPLSFARHSFIYAYLEYLHFYLAEIKDHHLFNLNYLHKKCYEKLKLKKKSKYYFSGTSSSLPYILN